jgi:hypothetical protein
MLLVVGRRIYAAMLTMTFFKVSIAAYIRQGPGALVAHLKSPTLMPEG